MKDFAQYAFSAGLINKFQLTEVRRLGEIEGGIAEKHFLTAGIFSEKTLYLQLSEYWKIDLLVFPEDEPSTETVSKYPLDIDLFKIMMPWSEDSEGTLNVATCFNPSESQLELAREKFGVSNIVFKAISESDLYLAIQKSYREEMVFEASERFATDYPEYSAKRGLMLWQKLIPLAFAILVIICFILAWHTALIGIVILANAVFISNVGFKVIAVVFQPITDRRNKRALALQKKENKKSDETGFFSKNRELPRYTILVPVYKEANVIAGIIKHLNTVYYPKSKLDILILMEESDLETIEVATAAAKNYPQFRIVVVPPGGPQTKPRACNYGLMLAKGEYVVIYDAEDRPDLDQLLKVNATFRLDRESSKKSNYRPLGCVQAALNYYNASQNLLTRMFAVEYSQWFDAMLPGMDAIDLPIPLGGTSNHFLKTALVEAGGWDPYNVTEDADLGLRLASTGYLVSVVQSATWEEAVSETWPWIKQRTRWIKGYILTSGVNMRHPISWSRKNGILGVLTMWGLIIGTPLSFLLYPVALGFSISAWLLGPVFPIWIPSWLILVGMFNMVIMNILMITSSFVAVWRRCNWRIAVFSVILPAYWILHSFAAWRAFFQAIFTPHVWEKTPHGLGGNYEEEILKKTHEHII